MIDKLTSVLDVLRMRWLWGRRITLTLLSEPTALALSHRGRGDKIAFEMTGMKSDKFGGRGRVVVFGTFVAVLVALLASMACFQDTSRSLVLTTTTSTYDSGLLDYIIPPFEEEYNANVRVISVGTGQALAIGARGDADVVLVHAPTLEEKFVADGNGVNRTYVMYNDFVILGPQEDPAGISGLKDGPEAFRRIAATESIFASRGDESGTHVKEKELWVESGVGTPESEDWYLSLGQGMGGTLTTADELGAYTLTDRGTFLSRKNLNLDILAEGDETLFNPYHIIIVNPEKYIEVQKELAEAFVDFLISEETQESIREFRREEYGVSLFNPVHLEGVGP